MTTTPEQLEGTDFPEQPQVFAENPVNSSGPAYGRRGWFRKVFTIQGMDEPEVASTPLSADVEQTTPDPLEAVEKLPEVHEPREMSRRSVFRVFGKVALVTAWAVGGTVAAEKVDQFIGDKIWPSTKPQMHEILPETQLTSEQLQHGTFVCGGFNTKNATTIATALKASLGSNGRLFGIEYDNKGIQLDELVDAMEVEIEAKGLKEISLYGHSMGGDVMLMAAAELAKRRPELVFRNIMLDCTPSGFEAVRAKNKGIGSFFANLKIRGGPGIRMAIELWNSPNRHTFFAPATPVANTRAILNRMIVIKNEKFNSYSASNNLAADQLNVIEAIDVPNIFSYLAEATKKQLRPLEVTMLRPRNGAQDGIVDVDVAETAFRAAGTETGVRVSTLMLDGAEIHHADPVESAEKYNAQIWGMLQSQAESYRMLLAARLELVRLENNSSARSLGAAQNGLHPN